jgi:pimeloyl-ACP methyl ester carboxylesterase
MWMKRKGIVGVFLILVLLVNVGFVFSENILPETLGEFSLKEYMDYPNYPNYDIISKEKITYENDDEELIIEIIEYNSTETLFNVLKNAISEGIQLDKERDYFSFEEFHILISESKLIQMDGLYCLKNDDGIINEIKKIYPVNQDLLNEIESPQFLTSSDQFTALASCSSYGMSSCSNFNDEKRVGNKRYECNYAGTWLLSPLCWEHVSSNGNSGFCTSGAPCTSGQYDCDFDSQCSGSLICAGELGGDSDGCCYSGQGFSPSTGCCNKGPTNEYRCYNDNVERKEITNNCGYVWKTHDNCGSDEKCSNNRCISKICSDYAGTQGSCSSQGSKKILSDSILKCNDVLPGLQIKDILCWESFSSNSDGNYCNELEKLGFSCNRNQYDCDSNSECSGSLICDGESATLININEEGCCYNYENWNQKDDFCNKAVAGKVYNVNQINQYFSDSPYKNLKLRVFIKDDDLIEDDILWYFDIYTDSQGNFNFNPERYVSNWNWDTLFVDYAIEGIYAIENNEVIGKWTNQFSNKDKFRKAENFVDQIVRIHKDKGAWGKSQIPISENGEAFKIYSDKDFEGKEIIFLKWRGKLIVPEEGEYNLKFNVSGEVLLKINNQTYIDTKKNISSDKNALIYLKNNENEVYFEFYEKTKNNPLILWSKRGEELKEISEANFIKEETKIELINNKNELLKFTSSSDVLGNVNEDYMISFLEKPQTIRSQKPIIFVHGKHGTSGYWQDDSQDYFNDLGYDAWGFYYPGEDYIDKSGALLGDSLDYLKDNYYENSQDFDIITHSMGGLVARSYVQSISPYTYKNDVNHLIMVAPPNYGNGASTGIAYDWKTLLDFIPYKTLEEIRIGQGGSNSPIYKQMSLSSSLIEALYDKSLLEKSLVIIGNEDDELSLLDMPSICTFLTFAHRESDSNEYDCLVSISSSSLLNKLVPLSIINDKNHLESSKIIDYSQLITAFLNDYPDFTLAHYSYAYHNPKTGYKSNFNQYDEGSIQIKLIEDGQIWNPYSNSDLEIEKVSTTQRFKLTRNTDSKNYFHFNRNDNEIDSYYTLPAGEYKLVIPSISDNPNMHFEIKPMETNFLEINLTQDPAPINNGSDPVRVEFNGYSITMINELNTKVNMTITYNRYSSWLGTNYDVILERQINPQDSQIYTDSFSNTVGCGTSFACSISLISMTYVQEDPEDPEDPEPPQTPSILTITSLKNNSIHSERRIPFIINASEKLEKIEYIDYSYSRPRWRTICTKCDKYNGERSFSAGKHNIILRGTSYLGETEEHEINFINDYTSPRISKTEPRRNKYTNGENFYIKFRENNPISFSVNYNPTIDLDLGVCEENRGYWECYYDLNLSDYDGKEIEYKFILEDIVGNVVESRPTSIKVDTTPPVLNNPDSFWRQGSGRYARYIYFEFNVSENNFDEISYTYLDSRGRLRERRLCSRLKDSICEVKKSFRRGNQELGIIIKDEAGNVWSDEIEFEVDY